MNTGAVFRAAVNVIVCAAIAIFGACFAAIDQQPLFLVVTGLAVVMEWRFLKTLIRSLSRSDHRDRSSPVASAG